MDENINEMEEKVTEVVKRIAKEVIDESMDS